MTIDKIVRPKYQCFVREDQGMREYVLDQHAKRVYEPNNLHAMINPFRREAEFKLHSEEIEEYERIWLNAERIYTHNDHGKRMEYLIRKKPEGWGEK